MTPSTGTAASPDVSPHAAPKIADAAIRDDIPRMAAALAASAPRGRLPTQAIILALVAVLVIPGILFAGFLLMRYAESERARYELEGIGVARGVATVLDRHLQGLQNTLLTLATSSALAEGDLKTFWDQAARVKSHIGNDIVLRDASGQQFVSTRWPPGSPLPRTPLPIDQDVLKADVPVVTNVFPASTTGRPVMAIVVAVEVAGTKHLLHINSPTDDLHDVVKTVTPPRWLIGVGDANGVYVTRSERHADFTGTPGAPAYIALADKHEGSFIGESGGEPALVGYSHTAFGNWLVAANIPQAVVEANLTDAFSSLTAFGVGILLLSSLVALWLWRFVARPLAGLAVAGRQVGNMRTPARVETSLHEFVAVQDALAFAAEQVRAHSEILEAKVDERTRELAQINNELLAQMTAREKAESDLRQFQKIEAVGQLTGGIAHDFNNMLSIMLSSLSLIQRRIDRGETGDLQRFVNTALEGVNRAKTLTSRLLAFSRQQPLAPDVLDPNRLVGGMSELLRRTLGEQIRVHIALGAGVWNTYADGPQLENALVNLCVNARDAMIDGGRLTIETQNTYLDDEYCRDNDATTPGQYIEIAVSDTGTGMSPDVAARAFDPFFTTKRTGMGTGLGLSQVYGFVKQSKGHIKIYSEPGHGTTIKIYLPRQHGGEIAVTARGDARPVATGSAHEVILVVEDEERLRQLTCDTLRELGYTVLEAGHAIEALELVDRHPEIALLFTDIVMPDVNGRQLADEVMARRPGIRVLYTSGFTRGAVIHNGILDTGINFISKPFTIEDLSVKVRQILSDVRTPYGAGGWQA
ncbi:MAG: histidine kinase [Rhodospirillales bacterium]|nr:histidine kinase [Rhodospirillales bacterium]